MSQPIKPRERDAILQSIRAGVVPRAGLHHLQVGRRDEVQAVLDDLKRVEEGGATVRFVIGRYGSGKSFFLNLMRTVALERKFVVAQADVTLERRLHGSGGQARNLYAELMQNVAIRTRPDGGALASIVERWASQLDHEVREVGGADSDVTRAVHTRLKVLQDLVGGFDFATVIAKYIEGFLRGDEALTTAALRWLRADYRVKTEARQDLGVRSIIDDGQFYDFLKLFACFCRLAGYAGFLVNIDEMGVFSHRLNSSQARSANYEVILRIVNDCLQGNVSGLSILFGGTDNFLEDKRRGLYSYEALATRLAANSFATDGLKDLSGPVIRLRNLTLEELFALLQKLRHIAASGDVAKYAIEDEGLKLFLQHCSTKLGANFFQTPREVVKEFAGLLSVLDQNPNADWKQLLGKIQFEKAQDPEADPAVSGEDDSPPATGDSLTSFTL